MSLDLDVDIDRHTLALNRLAHESLYVSGAPGTGKSTFCRWVAWLVAEGAMPALGRRPADEFAETLDDGLKGRLPVLLRLREFWEYLPPRAGAGLTVSELEDAICRWVDKKRPDGLDSDLFRAHLAHGSALLILDGMDEVPVEQHDQRRQVASAPAAALGARRRVPGMERGGQPAAAHEPTLRSHRGSRPASTGLGPAPLQPLPRELQTLLAHRWFAVLSGDARGRRRRPRPICSPTSTRSPGSSSSRPTPCSSPPCASSSTRGSGCRRTSTSCTSASWRPCSTAATRLPPTSTR